MAQLARWVFEASSSPLRPSGLSAVESPAALFAHSVPPPTYLVSQMHEIQSITHEGLTPH